jgi:prefoldin subunit 5
VSDEDFKEQLETLNEELETLNAQARDLEQTIARSRFNDGSNELGGQEVFAGAWSLRLSRCYAA